MPGCVCSLEGRCDNFIPTQFLALLDCLKILALDTRNEAGGMKIRNEV
jgi:hypothetical protein